MRVSQQHERIRTDEFEPETPRRDREIAEAARLIASGGPKRRSRQRDAAARLARVLRDAAAQTGIQPETQPDKRPQAQPSSPPEAPVIEVLAKFPLPESMTS
ncbi:MAG: hypothetical protein AAFR38_13540 [Planctomycetota bacterium]